MCVPRVNSVHHFTTRPVSDVKLFRRSRQGTSGFSEIRVGEQVLIDRHLTLAVIQAASYSPTGRCPHQQQITWSHFRQTYGCNCTVSAPYGIHKCRIKEKSYVPDALKCRNCWYFGRQCGQPVLLICQDDQSDVLVGADGMRHSYWPARVLANELSTSIYRQLAAKNDRLHACRDKQQQHNKHARIPGSYPDVLANVVSGGSGRTESHRCRDRRKVVLDAKKREARQMTVARDT